MNSERIDESIFNRFDASHSNQSNPPFLLSTASLASQQNTRHKPKQPLNSTPILRLHRHLYPPPPSEDYATNHTHAPELQDNVKGHMSLSNKLRANHHQRHVWSTIHIADKAHPPSSVATAGSVSLDLGFFCFIQGSGVFWLWSNCRFFIEEYSGFIGVVCRASSQCSWVGLGLTKLFEIWCFTD